MTTTRSSKKTLAFAALALVATTLVGCQNASVPDATQSADPVPVDPSDITTTIVRIVDGRTLLVEPVADVLGIDEYTPVPVMLAHIDVPSMQPHQNADPECGAQDATDRLSGLLPVRTVVHLSLLDTEIQDNGMYLATAASTGIEDVSLAMVSEGYAWAAGSDEFPVDPAITDAQAAAEKDDLALWATCELSTH